MTHAYLPHDPIHAVITRHRAAFNAYQIAPDGAATVKAFDEYEASGLALTATPSATRYGALSLLGHLLWWLDEEAENSASYQPTYGLAEARAGDLALFLGDALPPAVIPTDLPPGRLSPPRRAVNLRRVSR